MHPTGTVHVPHIGLALAWLDLPGSRRAMWWWQDPSGRRVWGVFAGDA